MRIEIIRDWNNCRKGRFMEVADGFGNELIRRKIAKPADDVECMAVSHSKAETAVLNRNPRKRG